MVRQDKTQSDSRGENDRGREELVALVMRHQHELFSYVFRLIPNYADAQDVFQETVSVICRKFDDYHNGSDFRAWAYKIAYWEVRRARTKFARSKLLFSEEAVSAIAAASEAEQRNEPDLKQQALPYCLHELKERDRRMILARYEVNGGVERAAECSGRSIVAAYKALARVRKALQLCITERIRAEGAV